MSSYPDDSVALSIACVNIILINSGMVILIIIIINTVPSPFFSTLSFLLLFCSAFFCLIFLPVGCYGVFCCQAAFNAQSSYH